MKYIYFFLLFSVFVSCGTTRKQSERIQEVKRDSIVIEKIAYRVDTVAVSVPVLITQKAECDSVCNDALQKALEGLKVTSVSEKQKTTVNVEKGRFLVVSEQAPTENVFKSETVQHSHEKHTKTNRGWNVYYFFLHLLAFVGLLCSMNEIKKIFFR